MSCKIGHQCQNNDSLNVTKIKELIVDYGRSRLTSRSLDASAAIWPTALFKSQGHAILITNPIAIAVVAAVEVSQSNRRVVSTNRLYIHCM